MKETEEQYSLIKRSISYNPETGVFLWKDPKSTKIKKGSIAGSINVRGYRVISCGNKIYLAHRLAWLFCFGEWPRGNIDHINHDCSDNRICNLRVASQGDNCKNQSLRSNNTSGHVGVWYNKTESRWIAEIMIDYKKVVLGRFKVKEDAIKARSLAEIKYGFHENHGKAVAQ